MSVLSVQFIISVNTDCAQNNGGCSHFCFPTSSGFSCGCEIYYALLSDGKTCENGIVETYSVNTKMCLFCS